VKNSNSLNKTMRAGRIVDNEVVDMVSGGKDAMAEETTVHGWCHC